MSRRSHSSEQRARHPVLNALIVLAIIVILAALSVPPSHSLMRGQMVLTLNNLRQIYLAAYQMAQDYEVDQDPNVGWPGDLAAARGPTAPVRSLPEYVQRLVDYSYLKPSDAGKLFSAPGVRAYTGEGDFRSENSAFKIYLVTAKDTSDTLFGATKNFTFGKSLDARTSPYQDKAFCLIHKGGEAFPYYNPKSALNRKLGVLPRQGNVDDPGEETAENVWR